MHAFAHTYTQKERIYSDPDIVLSKAPSQVRETDVERGGGSWGEGQHEGRTNSLAVLKGIVLPAPFSHYTTVCVCMCVC